VSGVQFILGDRRYRLTLHEASVLHDWLDESESPARRGLAAAIRHEATFRRDPTVSLDLDDIAILRSALCAEYLGELPGLKLIRTALCEQAA
jgi:hypothetical protein